MTNVHPILKTIGETPGSWKLTDYRNYEDVLKVQAVITWGDSGVGNFFIRPDDLKALNFDRVWYNWDCY